MAPRRASSGSPLSGDAARFAPLAGVRRAATALQELGRRHPTLRRSLVLLLALGTAVLAFLAPVELLDRRTSDLLTDGLPAQPLGASLTFDAGTAAFQDWYPAEGGRRWSQRRSTIHFVLEEVDPERLHLLELDLSAPAPQAVDVLVNDANLGTLHLGEPLERQRVLALPGTLLEAHGANRLTLRVGRTLALGDDRRRLGAAFRSLRLRPLPEDFDGVHFDDEAYFAHGWGEAVGGRRRSAASEATLVYPLGPTPRELAWEVVLEAGASDTQRVEVLVNGDSVATTRLEGAEPKRLAFPVAVQTLRAWSLNTVTIRIAGARIGEDSPPLGIALVRLHVQPRPPG